MKILYHHRIASKDGQYVHVEELTNAMLEQGHELRFVAPGFTEESDFGSEGGIAARLKAMLPKWFYELLELLYGLLIACKLITACLRDRPDFIYERYNLYQPVGVIVAKLFRLPILLEVNAPLVDERRKYNGLGMPWLANHIEVFTWRWATAVLPVTQVLADMVITKGVPAESVHVIQNGINQRFYNELEDESVGREKGSITIGFVGFIHRWHGLDLAIEAIAACKDKNIKLVCVGDGDIRDELEAQCRQLGVSDRVEFTGLKNREEVFGYVKEFDIALQPAVTPYASPLKLFEYLAVGSLVIAPDSANILEVLDDDSALLFKNNDKEDFKKKLIYAIDHIDELRAKRLNARRLIVKDGYTWQQNAERVAHLATECGSTAEQVNVKN